ncbi:hypothetical protein KCP69_26750 (plasmid) [Salmonella enterica subsp. enterica]|nr:hypothetical protein KCP69_26750 [Salmonella enterica subsp. enterica]
MPTILRSADGRPFASLFRTSSQKGRQLHILIDTGLKVYGAGQLAPEGETWGAGRRDWRKLHLQPCARSRPADGAMMVAPGRSPTITTHGDNIIVAIPPRAAWYRRDGPPCQRDRHLGMIQEKGRLWHGEGREIWKRR